MPGVTADANSRGGVNLEITSETGGIGIELTYNQTLTLASRIMNQIGVTSLTNNPDGTWTAQ